MDDIVKDKLKNAGIDLDDAFERFMKNEALYEKFLKRFPSDQNYEKFLKAMDDGDINLAFTAAHTLKGVCGNLSLSSMFNTISVQTELLRGKDLDGATKLMPELRAQYEKAVGIITECFG